MEARVHSISLKLSEKLKQSGKTQVTEGYGKWSNFKSETEWKKQILIVWTNFQPLIKLESLLK